MELLEKASTMDVLAEAKKVAQSNPGQLEGTDLSVLAVLLARLTREVMVLNAKIEGISEQLAARAKPAE
jgi:hypothetical protein